MATRLTKISRLFVACVTFFLIFSNNCLAVSSYDRLLTQANLYFQQGNLYKSSIVVVKAIKLDDTRYEAYALAALIRIQETNITSAQEFLDKACLRVPPDERKKLDKIEKYLRSQSQQTKSADQSAEIKRKLEVLKLILADADNAKTFGDRNSYLQEFLNKSDELIVLDTNILTVWSMRGTIALELNKPNVGWEAGQHMLALGGDNDLTASKVLVQLDRKGWLTSSPPRESNAQSSQSNTSSLGSPRYNGTWEGWVTIKASVPQSIDPLNGVTIHQRWRIQTNQGSNSICILLLESHPWVTSDGFQSGEMTYNANDRNIPFNFEAGYNDNHVTWNSYIPGALCSGTTTDMPITLTFQNDGISATLTENNTVPRAVGLFIKKDIVITANGTFQKVN